MISGPELIEPLSGHSMVALGLGQAIIGGLNHLEFPKKKIYNLECSRGDCIISKIGIELSIERSSFVAIPIPEDLSGCILEGKSNTSCL